MGRELRESRTRWISIRRYRVVRRRAPVATENFLRVASIEVAGRSPIACRHVVRRRLAAPLVPISRSLARVAAPGNRRTPTPARGRGSISPPPSPLHSGRPNPVGVALAGMAQLARNRAHCEAPDYPRVAPQRLSPILDIEEPRPHREAGRTTRRSSPDPRDVRPQPAVGCASDPRGTSEAGRLAESVDRCEVHATTSAPAVTNLADFPH